MILEENSNNNYSKGEFIDEKMTLRVSKLQDEITNYFKEHNYKFVADITTITSKSQDITYICACDNEKTKKFKDIIRRGCRDCNNKLLKEVPTDYSVCPNDDAKEKWVAVEGGFISSKGRAINSHGKILSQDERGRYFLAGKLQYSHILMAKGFKIENSDKLEGSKSNLVVRNRNKEELNIENIYIGTRNEIGQENGKKSRQSEDFFQSVNTNVLQHAEKYKYKTVLELPNHRIFEDGKIFNTANGRGNNRFLSFSKTSSKTDEKQYYKFITLDGNFYVHRLVCYAFKPIDGLNKLEDYKNYDVNHIDGNTLNNHINNLEWVTHSSNMAHAYDEKLNLKVRAVLQYKLNNDGTQGDFIKEYESLAQASRELNIPEHRIRECAKLRTKPKDFIWKYKNEDENEEWSKKFSSKV